MAKVHDGCVEGGSEFTAFSSALRSFAGGDRSAFERVFVRLSPWVCAQAYGRARRSGLDVHEAEDVASEVWSRALDALPKIDPRGSRKLVAARKLLCRMTESVVASVARTKFRRRRRIESEGARDLDRVGTQSRPSDPGGAQELYRAVEGFVADLDDDVDREVFICAILERHERSVVAAAVGLEPGALNTRICRLRRRLRERLASGGLL